MNFLEARRVVAQFAGGQELPFLFALSGTPDPFRIYLEAAGAKRGFSARPRFLPFNTLRQHLVNGEGAEREVFLLLPWDFVPETDWRSGVPAERTEVSEALARAERVGEQLRRRRDARILYLAGQIPPVIGHGSGDRALARGLDYLAAGLGAVQIPPAAFSLGSYFSSGCPVGGASLGGVAEAVLEALAAARKEPSKVLVTDLDDTLWAGVIAEDGPDGIAFGPEGPGYRHYVYQTWLARLRSEGVVLAAVTRNDASVALPPLRSRRMVLGEGDFVAVCASYHAKSAQIRQLAQKLNLGLESFVFVDDNPVEQEEVRRGLPQVRVLAFPPRDDDLPAFLEELAGLFGRSEITREDRERTRLYQRRLEGLAPADVSGADLTAFLADLEMKLVVHDRTRGDRARAIQLINKTNQFNANGRRWTVEEIEAALRGGARLFGASLADRSGSHGEILACLVGPDGVIEAFVMSCRVFQRRVEFAFLAALAGRGIEARAVRFAETERNEPFRQFLRSLTVSPLEGGVLHLDLAGTDGWSTSTLDLFDVVWD